MCAAHCTTLSFDINDAVIWLDISEFEVKQINVSQQSLGIKETYIFASRKHIYTINVGYVIKEEQSSTDWCQVAVQVKVF